MYLHRLVTDRSLNIILIITCSPCFYKFQCIISYGGGGPAGFYVVALQVEDYLNNERLSSVPVQFLVNLFDSPSDCESANPILVGETPQDGDCISIAPGGTFRASVVARVRTNGSR